MSIRVFLGMETSFLEITRFHTIQEGMVADEIGKDGNQSIDVIPEFAIGRQIWKWSRHK
jgi:hypothetical protein